jgi:FkbM family methyltransferase
MHARRLPEVAACLRSCRNGIRIAASYVGLTDLPLPYALTLRNGLRYQLEEYYDLETLWQIHFHRVYRLRPTDRVIVDAGANIGLFTCWAAASNPNASIVAIEPAPGNFERLCKHVHDNGLASRVTTLPVALSSRNETLWLTLSLIAGQMNSVGHGLKADAVAVDAVTLPMLLEQLPFAHIDFLKMDIEGSEYGVLMSLTPRQFERIRRLTVEYHGTSEPGSTKTALVQHLEHVGFRRIVDRHPRASFGIIDASRD